MEVFYLVSLWWSRDGPNHFLYRAFICVNQSGALFFVHSLSSVSGSDHFSFFRCFFLFANTDAFVFQNKDVAKTQKLTPLKPHCDLFRAYNPNQT